MTTTDGKTEAELIIPHINTVLYSKIELEPIYLNNDIFPNLLCQIKSLTLGKCNEYGYVQRINQIENYDTNEIDCENRNGSVIFNVVYNAQLYIPKINMKVVAKVDKFTDDFTLFKQGPLVIIVTSDEYNKDKFYINDKGRFITNSHSQKLIGQGDYCNIIIKDTRFSPGDKCIKAIGFLDDISTDEEKLKYFAHTKMDDNGEI